MKRTVFLLSFVCCFSCVRAENLLVGDPDVETEYRSMTYGTWNSNVPGVFRERNYTHDATGAYSGKYAIRMIRPGELSTLETAVLPEGEYVFSFMAKSDRNGSEAFIGVTPFLRSTWGKRLSNRKSVTLTTEWKRYFYTFKADGAHSYVPNYGLKTVGVSAFFDAFVLNRGNTPEDFKPVNCVGIILPEMEGYVFLAGERIPVTVKAAPGKKVDVTVVDYEGKTILKKSGTAPLAFELPNHKKGWFGITAESGNAKDFQSVVIVSPPRKLSGKIPPFAGLCGAQELPEASRRIGVRWIEAAVIWNHAEKQQGVFDFEYLLKYAKAKALRDQGFALKTFFVLNPPPWAQSEENRRAAAENNINSARFLPPPESDDLWRRFIRAFLKQYGNDFDLLETGGELDAANGLNLYYKRKYTKDIVANFAAGPVAERCAALIDIVNDEVRKIRPDAKLAAVRPSDVDSRYAYAFTGEVVKRCRTRLNRMGIDCYPQPRWIGPGQPAVGLERDLKKNYENISRVMKKHTPDCGIYVSEYGYFIDRNHIYDPKYQVIQANRLARSFLFGRAIGLDAFFYYAAYYPDNLMEANRFTMHLWRHGNPLSAVAAFSVASDVVEDVTNVHFTDLSDKLTVITFSRVDGSAVTAMWSIDPDYAPEIEFGKGDFQFQDMMGNPLSGKSLLLGENPIYVRGGDFIRQKRAAEAIVVKEDIPAELFFRPASESRLKCYVLNKSNRKTQSGRLEYRLRGKHGSADRFAVIRGDKTIVDLPMPGRGETLEMIWHFDGGYQPYRCEYKPPVIHEIGRTPYSVTVSGKDSILPADHTTWDGAEDLSMKLYWSHDAGILHFRAVVTDDLHFNRYTGENIWRGDCLQIGMDPRTNFIGSKSGIGTDDFILTLALDGNQRPALTVHNKPAGSSLEKHVRYHVVRDEKKKETVYTMSVPLKEIDPLLEHGRIFGFSCVVMEDDSGTGADHWMFLSPGLAGERRPDLFSLFMVK